LGGGFEVFGGQGRSFPFLSQHAAERYASELPPGPSSLQNCFIRPSRMVRSVPVQPGSYRPRCSLESLPRGFSEPTGSPWTRPGFLRPRLKS
jgi:hypothetical protein